MKKKYILCNTRLLGVCAVGIFVYSLLLDFILPSGFLVRRVFPGFFIHVFLSGSLTTVYYLKSFGRLAERYPMLREELLATGRSLAPFAWCRKEERNAKQIDMPDGRLQLPDSEQVNEQINREWRRGKRWCLFSTIGWISHLPLIIIFSDWIVACQSWVMSHIH